MKFGIYARVSTSDGKQNYDRQIQELKDYIKFRYPDFKDEDIEVFPEMVSGYKKDERERGQLKKLLDICRNESEYFNTIFVTEISRLGRNPKITRDIIEELTELKVNIYIKSLNLNTLDEHGRRNSITNIILQILMEYSDMESQTFKERSKSGLLKSVRDGKVGGGRIYPYGYTKGEDKMLVVHPTEKDVILSIFKWYSEGKGTKVISKLLNSQSIPTRYNKSFLDQDINFKIQKKGGEIKWSDGQVYGIITNPIYKGTRRYKGMLIECPSIISEELFDKCQEIRQSKKVKISGKYVFLLKDLLKCGVCGRNYVGTFKIDEKVYKCGSTRHIDKNCNNKGVNISLVESVLFHLISVSSDLIDHVNFSTEVRNLLLDEKKQLMLEIDGLEYELGVEKKVPEKLITLYQNSPSFTVEQFEGRMEIVNSKINKIQTSLKIKKSELEIKVGLLNSSNNTKRETLIGSKKDRSQMSNFFIQFFDRISVKEVSNSSIFLDVYVKLYNGSILKFGLVLDRKGIMKKEKKYSYCISECLLIIGGVGHLIVSSRYKEGVDVKSIGREVVEIFKNVDSNFSLTDTSKMVNDEHFVLDKFFSISEDYLIKIEDSYLL